MAFRLHRNHCHKGECLSKVLELEFAIQGAVDVVPTVWCATHVGKAMRSALVAHATPVPVVGTAGGATASSAMRELVQRGVAGHAARLARGEFGPVAHALGRKFW